MNLCFVGGSSVVNFLKQEYPFWMSNSGGGKIYLSVVRRQTKRKSIIFKIKLVPMRKYRKFLFFSSVAFTSKIPSSEIPSKKKSVLPLENNRFDKTVCSRCMNGKQEWEVVGCFNLLHLRSGVFIKAIKHKHKHQPEGFIFIELSSFKLSEILSFLLLSPTFQFSL